MARSPGGALAEPKECAGLSSEEAVFAAGLEAVIDKLLERIPRGERVVYGIHQEIGAATSRCLVERYLAAGWSDVRILPGATGAATLVLAP